MCCHTVKSFLENLLEKRGTAYLLQTLKMALTIPMYLLSCLFLLSSGSSYLLVIKGGTENQTHTWIREEISSLSSTNHPYGLDFRKRVSTEPIVRVDTSGQAVDRHNEGTRIRNGGASRP